MSILGRPDDETYQTLKTLMKARNLLEKQASATRRPAGNIVREELRKLLYSQVRASIRNIFGPPPSEKDEDAGGWERRRFPDGNVIFNARDRDRGPFDQRKMEFMVDQMVASSLMHGRQTSGVLRVLFGLVPSLIGR